MKINKINDYICNYKCGDGVAISNLTNGNLRFVYPLIALGVNNYKISTNLVFNSQYKSTDFANKKIGFGDGWKLNLHQYVFPYLQSYNMEGFEVGDYIYIDEFWNIHRFVFYKTKQINGVTNEVYYSSSNTSLTLYCSNENKYIFDEQNNKLVFNSTGHLINIISGLNENIIKTITYDSNNQITGIYDERKSTQKIYFSYKEGQLEKIYTSVNNKSYIFLYIDNLLNLIKKTNKNKTKEVMGFLYSDEKKLTHTVCKTDLTALNFEYDLNERLIKLVNGYLKKNYHCVNEVPEAYVGENLYIGEDIYITNKCWKINGVNYEMSSDTILNILTYKYTDTYLDVTNEKNITIRYFYNTIGDIISSFELKDGKLYTLTRPLGLNMSKSGNIEEYVNNEKAYQINSQSQYELKQSSYEELRNEISAYMYNINKIFNHQINVSFYIKPLQNNLNSGKVTFTFEINGFPQTQTVLIGKMLKDAWQKVDIPLTLDDGSADITNLYISFDFDENQDLLISNVYIDKSSNSDVIFKKNNVEYFLSCDKKIYTDLINNSVEQSTEMFLTYSDLLSTYKSIYLSRYNNEQTYDLHCCNKTKIIEVTQSGIQKGNISIEFNLDDNGIPNMFVRNSNLYEFNEDEKFLEDLKYYTYVIQPSFKFDTNKEKHYIEIKEKFGVSTINSNIITDDNLPHYRITRQYFDGIIFENQYDDGRLYEYSYDSYGNILYNQFQNLDDPEGENIIEEYIYDESNEKLREIYTKYKCNNEEISFVYNKQDGLLKRISNSKLNKTLNYDDYDETISSVTFEDKSNVLTSQTNTVGCKTNGMIKSYSDGISKYNFNYNNFGELLETLQDRKVLHKIKNTRTNNENSIYNYFNTNSPKIIMTKSDNYGNIEIVKANNQKKYGYGYANDSNNYSLFDSKISMIENTDAGYLEEYDINNKINKYTIKLVDTNTEIKKYSSGDYEYMIYGDERLTIFNQKNDNMLNDVVTETKYLKINPSDPSKKIVDGHEEFNFFYNYDYLNRLNKKQSLEKEMNESNGAKVVIDKEISYKINTSMPSTIVNKVISKIDSLDDETATISFTNVYEKGKVIQTSENTQRFATYPTDSSSRNKIINQQRNNFYIYDTFDRITHENNFDLGIYQYQYDSVSGDLTKIINQKGEVTTTSIFEYDKRKLTKISNNGNIKLLKYDDFGNLIQYGNNLLTYNSFGQLESYSYVDSDNKNKLVKYIYDYAGRRVKKEFYEINNGVNTLKSYKKYYYDGNKLLGENWHDSNYITTNKLRYYYDIEGITGIKYNNKNYVFIYDSIRNISKIVCDGKTLGEYVYNAWGICELKTFTALTSDELFVLNNNPFRYKGYYYDVETNLALVSSRYYSPELGRFIQPADVSSLNPQSINGLNLYSYANDNPIGLAYSSSGVGFGDCGTVLSSISLGGLFCLGNNLDYSNSFNSFAGLNWPKFNTKDLVKDTFISLGEVGSRIAWGLTKNGRAFLDFHNSAYGINGYTALDNLSSTSAKIFKGIGIGLMALDVIEAGYYSYQNGHSFGQGALNVGLTAGKNLLVYKASTGVATAVGIWAGAKLGASLGSAAGPVGFVIGTVAGAAVGWVIDEFGDVIIDWVVGWFD